MSVITKDVAQDLLENACNYQGDCLQARDINRELYRKSEDSSENIIRGLIDGLIAKIATEQAPKIITESNEKISYQISLATSFIRSHYLISDLFMAGDIIESVILIRKQFEILTRLHEIDDKPLLKLHKKTPNVCNVFKKSGKKIYPKLSEIAHFGTSDVGLLLSIIDSDEQFGPSLIPKYHEYSKGCLDLNCFMGIHFLGWFIPKLSEFHSDFDGNTESQILANIFEIAIDKGMIILSETP